MRTAQDVLTYIATLERGLTAEATGATVDLMCPTSHDLKDLRDIAILKRARAHEDIRDARSYEDLANALERLGIDP